MIDFDIYWKWASVNSGKTVNTLGDQEHLVFECNGEKMTIVNSTGTRKTRSKAGAKRAVKRYTGGETLHGDDRYFAAPFRHWKSAFISPHERNQTRQELDSMRAKSERWILEEIDGQPFFLADRDGRKRIWIDSQSSQTISLPKKAGIYLVYMMDRPNPVYVGMGSNLRQRMRYHFANNKSSDSNSTLKKNLRESGHWNGTQALEKSVRFKIVEVPFGRVELEKFLHDLWGINTSERRR